MKAKNTVTFDDIAKYTNFSKTTISRYFNHPDSLTPKNQEIISKALVKLNYQENKVARILANGKTEFVGIIIPDLCHHYYSEMLNHILATYDTFGYKFLVFIGSEQEYTERRCIQELMAYKVEGLIVLSHTLTSRELSALDIPIVTIEREDKYVCSVNTDNYLGGYKATEYLASQDCDVLIHINNFHSKDIRKMPAYGRIQGFIDCCKEHRLAHKLLLQEMGGTYGSIREQMIPLFEEIENNYSRLKKGIFLSNDTLADALLNILFRKYGHLPENYLLIGFDNSPVSQEAVIPLSTVGQQIDKIAGEAVSLLVALMNERKKRRPTPLSEPIHKTIAPVLIKRETS